MKTFIKLTFFAAVAAAFGTTAANADDPQLQHRLAMQRESADRGQRTTTVAVYVGERSFGRATTGVRTETERRPAWLHQGRGQVIPLSATTW
jgi:hypothetical protein